jgi:hypothetical protein
MFAVSVSNEDECLVCQIRNEDACLMYQLSNGDLCMFAVSVKQWRYMFIVSV